MDGQLNCSLNKFLLLNKNLLIERNCELKEFKWDSSHYRDKRRKKNKLMYKLIRDMFNKIYFIIFISL